MKFAATHPVHLNTYTVVIIVVIIYVRYSLLAALFFQKLSSATPLLNILDPRLDIYNQTKSKIETFSKHYFEIERGQKVAKKPNFFLRPSKKKRSQNRVIWPLIGQTTNPGSCLSQWL